MAGQIIGTYREFWPQYLREHSNAKTRGCHFVGTAVAVLVIVGAIVTRKWWFVLAGVAVGYLFAWSGHALFERNLPATTRHAFWSLISDLRMSWHWMTGTLGKELDRAGVPHSSR